MDTYYSTDQVNAEPTPVTKGTSSFVSLPADTQVSTDISPITISDTAAGDSESFFAARGTFYRVQLSKDSGPGLYAIEGLSQFITNARKSRAEATRRRKFDSTYPSKFQLDPNADIWNSTLQRVMSETNADIDAEKQRRDDAAKAENEDALSMSATPILILGIEIVQSDIVGPMSCLGNVKLVYTFGQALGNVVVRGEMLLGPLGNVKSDGVQVLLDFFNRQRVSNSKKTTAFSIAQTGYEMYLTGLGVGEVDQQFHILPFTMTGILLDPANQNAELFNPSNIVTDGETLTIESVLDDTFDSALNTPPKTAAITPAPVETTTVLSSKKQVEIATQINNVDAQIAKLQGQGTPESEASIKALQEQRQQLTRQLDEAGTLAGIETDMARRLKENAIAQPPNDYSTSTVDTGSYRDNLRQRINAANAPVETPKPLLTPSAPATRQAPLGSLEREDQNLLKVVGPPTFPTVKPVVRENKATR